MSLRKLNNYDVEIVAMAASCTEKRGQLLIMNLAHPKPFVSSRTSCSCTVGPEPQSRARKPPPLPLAAAATECFSTTVTSECPAFTVR